MSGLPRRAGEVPVVRAAVLVATVLVAGAVVVVLLPRGEGASARAATRADATEAAADEGARVVDRHRTAHGLLSRARDATTAPHRGRVTVVSFTGAGPRVAALDVAVTEDGGVLRTPSRVLVAPTGSPRGPALPPSPQRVLTSPLGLDVDALLAGWDVVVGEPVTLDTGRATPVRLVRRDGAAIRETLFVDDRTGIPVRRETRGPDGRVLRVVAYTALDAPATTDVPAPTGRVLAARTHMVEGLVHARAAGFHVPQLLDGGFVLVTVDVADEPGDGMAVARYSDGLSVVSVYQQHGVLDPGTLDGAVVHHVADRDVWSWPGREPVRYVWTGDGLTWTAVSDAPSPVIEDALASLPGDLVGHDAPHRLRRGLDRVWQFVTVPLR